MILAVLVMLLSSALYAPALVLQHKGTQQSIGQFSSGQPKFLDLLKNRVWLSGLILFYVAAVVHIVAISLGSLAVVQPLIVTELIFVPIAAMIISKTAVPGREWLAIVAVAAALAVFLVVAQPTGGSVKLSDGAFFGEMALLERQPRSASVATTRPTTLLVLYASDFYEIASHIPALAEAVEVEARRRREENLGRQAAGTKR